MAELCGDAVAKVAVAASGGVDSTVLLRSLHQLGHDVVALHVDHGLREEADADASFVRALASSLEVPYERLRVRVAAGNRQGEARAERYAALADAAQRHGCAVVVTGHTADDQAETVLMHLTRGAGLRGLAGMVRRRSLAEGVELVRPLLWATRSEIEAEARRHGWTWREDVTNASEAYLRNRVRHRILPVLKEEGGPDTVLRIAASARAVRAALPDLSRYRLGTERALGLDALRVAGDRAAVWVEALAAWSPETRRTRNLLFQLDGLVEGPAGRHVPMGRLVAWRDRDAVRFVAPAAPIDQVVHVGEPATTERGTLELVEMVPGRVSTLPQPALSVSFVLLRQDAMAGEVRLRSWRAGDRIQPTGMRGTKLVSDLLTERRVRPSERDRQLVLCVEEQVAWVVGHRVAAWASRRDPATPSVHATWAPRDSAG